METAIKIEHVSKSFGKKKILKDLTFETYTGEVFGFLGPNGAGKTTLIKMIVGLLRTEEGNISICGQDIVKHFEKAMINVGGIVENPELYKYMTGMQNLKQYARMRKGVTEERILEVVELVGLSNRINEKVGKYSLGMRQRLGVAQAILHHPKVLILDEPTNGLDPAGIKQLRDILKELAHKEKICVMVSSHLMSEMELMCDRVGIIANGELIDVKTVEELIQAGNGSRQSYHVQTDNSEKAMQILLTGGFLKEGETIKSLDNETFEISLKAEESREKIVRMNRLLMEHEIALYTVTKVDTANLEDVFIELTKTAGGVQIA